MDDIILIGSNDDDIQTLIQTLHSKFTRKYLGLLSYLLGIKVFELANNGIMINQGKYLRNYLPRKTQNQALYP